LKKAAQKLLVLLSRDFQTPVAQIQKSFLVLFFKKEPLASSLATKKPRDCSRGSLCS
jgi:hypothetical protein